MALLVDEKEAILVVDAHDDRIAAVPALTKHLDLLLHAGLEPVREIVRHLALEWRSILCGNQRLGSIRLFGQPLLLRTHRRIDLGLLGNALGDERRGLRVAFGHILGTRSLFCCRALQVGNAPLLLALLSLSKLPLALHAQSRNAHTRHRR